MYCLLELVSTSISKWKPLIKNVFNTLYMCFSERVIKQSNFNVVCVIIFYTHETTHCVYMYPEQLNHTNASSRETALFLITDLCN